MAGKRSARPDHGTFTQVLGDALRCLDAVAIASHADARADVFGLGRRVKGAVSTGRDFSGVVR